MRFITKFLALAVAVLFITSCNPHGDPPIPNTNSNNPPNNNPPNGSTDPINLGNCGSTASTDLIAGQHTVIGKVTVSTDGQSMKVVYELTEPNWGIVQTHLSVKGTWEEIPQAGNGNPIPGQFELKNNHNKIIGYVYENIDVSAWSQVSIAAHCKVQQLSGVNPNPIDGMMPGKIYQMDVDIFSVLSGQNNGFPYYLGLDLSSNTYGSGHYDAYCIDKGGQLSSHATYDVITVDPFVADLSNLVCLGIDQTNNVDLIAYIVNRYYVDQAYPGATAEELQVAIWTLLEPSGAIIATNELVWDQSIVDDILADAQNGNGYIPGLCDYRIMVNDPKCHPNVTHLNQDSIQSTISIVASQECVVIGEETAWGFGPQFPGRNWGMYFNYCVR
jgi:hypothetical protein